MKNCKLIAIDLAKRVFQVAVYEKRQLKSNRQMTRTDAMEMLSKEQPSLVVMEACGGAQHVARKAQSYGHEVMLLDPLFVKAFRRGQKTDTNDAIAIATASGAPDVQSCKIMSAEEQGMQAVMRIREVIDKQITQLSNQMRGLLSEFGVTIAKGDASLCGAVTKHLSDEESELPEKFKQALAVGFDLYKQQGEIKAVLNTFVQSVARGNETCKRLLDLEGVGPITAVELLSFLGNTAQFNDAKGAAACAGVTPTQHSTGGKAKIGRIPRRRGDMLRRNLFLGARAVVCRVKHQEPKTRKEQWIKQLLARKSVKCVAIALANKTVRTAYALVKNNSTYQAAPLAV